MTQLIGVIDRKKDRLLTSTCFSVQGLHQRLFILEEMIPGSIALRKTYLDVLPSTTNSYVLIL